MAPDAIGNTTNVKTTYKAAIIPARQSLLVENFIYDTSVVLLKCFPKTFQTYCIKGRGYRQIKKHKKYF